ncbi:unnamed protein product [Darwinula stevensoni]|uniref:C2H2-type domain-containing protein n=1 Tax=Darwinula stevensoni TaxID=69355 RepID=A0A7R9FN87_9CRUS|nr:unnamed protein product [Darwinula stevensoni]CAG0896423.1 unnamed protein product [Darwinula stevensoni]
MPPSIVKDQRSRQTKIRTLPNREKLHPSWRRGAAGAGRAPQLTNCLATPVLNYSFGVIDWSPTELQAIDRATRKLLTMHHTHHPKAAVERLYLPRCKGGRGLIELESLYKRTTCEVARFIERKQGRLISILRERDAGDATRFRNALHLDDDCDTSDVKTADRGQREARWKENPLHGRHPKIVDKPSIDSDVSYNWLKKGLLNAETESNILAIRDQCIRTRTYEKHVLKLDAEDRCRCCHGPPETVHHLLGACPELAPREYLYSSDVSYNWLKKGLLNAETESNVLAIQDQCIRTRNYEKHILKLDLEIPISKKDRAAITPVVESERRQTGAWKTFECIPCGEAFASCGDQKRHAYERHRDTTNGHPCLTCEEWFPRPSFLERHRPMCPQILIQEGKLLDEERRSLQCSQCRKTFTAYENLIMHKKKSSHFYGENSNSAPSAQPTLTPPPRSVNTARKSSMGLACIYCRKVKVSIKGRLRHEEHCSKKYVINGVISEDEARSMACCVCRKIYSNCKDLINHKTVSHRHRKITSKASSKSF